MSDQEENPFQSPEFTVETSSSSEYVSKPKKEPTGIGGWLILPMLGLFLTPVFSLISIAQILPFFSDGTWEALTDPASPDYLPLFGMTLLFELFFSIGFIGYAIIALILLFKKHYLFPKIMIAVYLINVFYMITDHILVNMIAPEDPEPITDVAKSIIAALIWCSYFTKSVRVKNTFVNGRKELEEDFIDNYNA